MSPTDCAQMVPTIKVVSSRCNLRCRYCYYHNRNQSIVSLVSKETLINLIKKTLEYVEKKPVVFVWHGGEPLLAGRELYEEILRIQEQCVGNRVVENHIQTNLTLIDDELAEFFYRNEFKVGTSIDGPKSIHDSCRIFPNDSGSFQRVMEGLESLKRAGHKPGTISLITRASLGKEKEIFHFMKNLGLKGFLPKPCYEIDPQTGKLTEFSVTPQEYANFMIKLFDLWVEDNDPGFTVKNLGQIMIALVGGQPSLCEHSGKCWLFPTIEYDGSVGACDSFPLRQYPYGNINEQSWEDLFSSVGFSKFISDIETNEKRCGDCHWLNLCHGCCLRYSFSAETKEWFLNAFCEAKKEIFSHIQRTIERIEQNQAGV